MGDYQDTFFCRALPSDELSWLMQIIERDALARFARDEGLKLPLREPCPGEASGMAAGLLNGRGE